MVESNRRIGSSPYEPSCSPLFVGRDEELRELRAAFERVRAGRGHVVLLAGEPGIGKTRASDVFATEMKAHGACVLWGGCYEWEGAPAYWPWLQLLRAYISTIDSDRLRGELGLGASNIAQIMPELRQRLPNLAQLPSMEPEQARFQLFDGLTTFLSTASLTHPLVLVLDDLHCADTASLLLLHFLVQNIRESRVLVVGTYRDSEINRHHPLSATLGDLTREPHCRRMLLRGLSKEDVGRFVSQTSGSKAEHSLVDAIYAETDGNPFFVGELVRLLASEGRLTAPVQTPMRRVPDSVREVIERRLTRLSPECNRVLSIASVVGREFSLAVLEAITPEPADHLVDQLDLAVHARLLDELDGLGRYRFSHALIQEAVYAQIPAADRRHMHYNVGEALEQLHAKHLEPHYPDLAYHYFRAASSGQAEKAFTYAMKTGQQAEAHLAWESAIGQYDRALQTLRLQEADERLRCDVLLTLGEAQNRAGAGRGREVGAGNALDAAATFMEAARAARTGGTPEQFARAASGVIGLSLSVGQGGLEASELIKEALDRLPADDSSLRAQLQAGYAAHRSILMARDVLPFDAVEEHKLQSYVDEAVTMARRLSDPATLAYTLHARCHVKFSPDDTDRQLVDAQEAIEAATRAEDPRLLVLALFDTYQVALFGADFQLAREVLKPLRRAAAPLRTRYFGYIVSICHAGQAMRDGRFDDAGQHVADALSAWPGGGIGTWENLAVLRERGRADEAADAVRWIYEQGPNVPMWRAMWLWALVETGQIDRARALFQTTDITHVADGPAYWTIRLMAVFAELCVTFNDRQRSVILYDQLLPYADRNVFAVNSDYTCGSAAYYLGLLATTLGRWEDAERHFAHALDLNEQWGIRPYTAYTRYHWAAMLMQRCHPGDHEQAYGLLDASLAAAKEMGMKALEQRAKALHDQLAASPARPSPQEPSRYGLSPREVEVLRLVVQGKTDKEIAEALFISHYTVMRHVSHILAKLNVDSRTAAATHALRNGLI